MLVKLNFCLSRWHHKFGKDFSYNKIAAAQQLNRVATSMPALERGDLKPHTQEELKCGHCRKVFNKSYIFFNFYFKFQSIDSVINKWKDYSHVNLRTTNNKYWFSM